MSKPLNFHRAGGGSIESLRQPTQAEYIAAQLRLERQQKRKVRAPSPITLRRFSWEEN